MSASRPTMPDSLGLPSKLEPLFWEYEFTQLAGTRTAT